MTKPGQNFITCNSNNVEQREFRIFPMKGSEFFEARNSSPTVMDTRPRQATEFFGKRQLSITIEDSVRVRDGQTHVFRDATVVALRSDEMTVQVEGSLVPIVVPMKWVNRHVTDGDYADGSSGSDGGASRQMPKTAPAVMPQISWSLDRIAKFYMKDTNGQTLASRATMVYHSNHVGACGELLPQATSISRRHPMLA